MRIKQKILLWGITASIVAASIFSTGCKMSNSEEDRLYTISFDTCTQDRTNKALDQKLHKGDLVEEPSISIRGENPDGKKVSGWYEDADYENEWDFALDKVSRDMTLYAKWDAYYTVKYYLKNAEAPVVETKVKGGKKTARVDDSVCGYKIKGYYSSNTNFTSENEFDFEQPITKATDIFIDVEKYLYFDGASLAKGFTAVAAPSGSGSTPGNITYEVKNEESYARVNFGYSTAGDPYICAQTLNADITESPKIEIKLKNLGNADQLALYWVLKDENGDIDGSSGYGEGQAFWYRYTDAQKNMKETDDWTIITIDASANSKWRNGKRLYMLRIQSVYTSTSTSDMSNELLISSIKGVD